MTNYIIKFFLIISMLYPGYSYAVTDRELQESRRCSNAFSFFEKKYDLPKDLLHFISLQETRKAHSKYSIGIVWPWTVTVEGKGFYFPNIREAVYFTRSQLRDGKTNIDVGCMQINLKYHPKAFKDIEQAFLPHKNIDYAAHLLRQHYNKHNSWEAAIGYYHSATHELASKYKAGVKRISDAMGEYKQKLMLYIHPTRSMSAKNYTQVAENHYHPRNYRPYIGSSYQNTQKASYKTKAHAPYPKLKYVKLREQAAIQYNEQFLQK